MASAQDTATAKPAPALKLNFLSHGTLESRDLAFSRRFYEEFLGLEIVQTSPISLLVRLGGPNTIAVVYTKHPHEMNLPKLRTPASPVPWMGYDASSCSFFSPGESLCLVKIRKIESLGKMGA